MAREDSFAVQGAVDLLASSGTGPLWAIASALNATLLAWPPGHEVAEHLNAELDVLVITLDGHASATIDGEPPRPSGGQRDSHPARNTPAHHGR